MRGPERWAAAAWLALAAGCAAGLTPQMLSDADRLAAARAYRQRGDCSRAIEALRAYVASSAGRADVDEAIYLLGDCYVAIKDYASGEVELERLLREYPESDSAPAAAFRLGEAYWGQAKKSDFDQEMTLKALAQWKAYVAGYPGHWLQPAAAARIAQARARLAQKAYRNGLLYVKLGLVGPARVYFQKVLEEFGDTPFAADAALGLALADIRRGDHETALAQLDHVQAEYPGTRAAQQAERERARLLRKQRTHGKPLTGDS